MALGKNLKSEKKEETEKQEVTQETEKKKSGVSEKTLSKKDWVEAAESENLVKEADKEGKKNLELLMVFPIGRESYALPISKVKEVVKTPAVAPLPQSPDYMEGVANIRGNVMAVIDLKKKLSGVRSDEKERAFIVVLKDEVYQAGLLVQQVPDTIAVDTSQINTSSTLIKNLSAEDNFIKGIVKKDKQMIILIDLIELFND